MIRCGMLNGAAFDVLVMVNELVVVNALVMVELVVASGIDIAPCFSSVLHLSQMFVVSVVLDSPSLLSFYSSLLRHFF